MLLASNGRLLSEKTPLCVANLHKFYIKVSLIHIFFQWRCTCYPAVLLWIAIFLFLRSSTHATMCVWGYFLFSLFAGVWSHRSKSPIFFTHRSIRNHEVKNKVRCLYPWKNLKATSFLLLLSFPNSAYVVWRSCLHWDCFSLFFFSFSIYFFPSLCWFNIPWNLFRPTLSVCSLVRVRYFGCVPTANHLWVILSISVHVRRSRQREIDGECAETRWGRGGGQLTRLNAIFSAQRSERTGEISLEKGI